MMFRNPEYTQARDMLAILARKELARQGWTQPTKSKCALRFSYRGRFDVDNALGFIMDALQNAVYFRDSQVVIATSRKRLKGAIGISIIVHTLERLK
jgi:Holliday junction resolvase RusA-like endonuclease